MVSNLDRALNRGHKQTDVIIMDFAKAFDKVLHRRLLYKLDYYGIRIYSQVDQRKLNVVKDDQASDPVRVLSGVSQVLVLAPVFFLIFLNVLPEYIKLSVRLFANGCELYRNIKSPKVCQVLQDDLNSLAHWESDLQMKVINAKCHSMRVTQNIPNIQI